MSGLLRGEGDEQTGVSHVHDENSHILEARACVMCAVCRHVMHSCISHYILRTPLSPCRSVCREGEALFDVILTSETTYTEGSSECVATLLQRHLRPLTGLALVAGKRYYFGTGGSMSDVTQRLARRGLTDVKVVATLDDGRSNIRDILAIRKAA